jgi:hypothetical protein
MNKNKIYKQSRSNFSIVLISVMLALLAVVISTKYEYFGNPDCNGYMGAGFPVLYICDGNGGGSPIHSWGKITSEDVLGGIKPIGFVFDMLFYTTLFFIVVHIIIVFYKRIVQNRFNT